MVTHPLNHIVWLLYQLLSMDQEDLKTLWFCTECGKRFIFRLDLEDHTKESGHTRIYKYDLMSQITSSRIDSLQNYDDN